jgi:hypothetical protein
MFRIREHPSDPRESIWIDFRPQKSPRRRGTAGEKGSDASLDQSLASSLSLRAAFGIMPTNVSMT